MRSVKSAGRDLSSTRQGAMSSVIHEGAERSDWPPMLHEVCDAVDLTRPSKVSHRFIALGGKECMRGGPDRSYTVDGRLREHPVLHLEAEDLTHARDALAVGASYFLVPVVGHIPAGELNPAEPVLEEAFLLAKGLVGDGPLFMLKVDGQSMIDAEIADGDWVIVRQQQHAENGEIVAAMIDGEVTVKTFEQVNDELWLVPRNPAYEPIPGGNATILGRVIGVVRQTQR